MPDKDQFGLSKEQKGCMLAYKKAEACGADMVSLDGTFELQLCTN